MSADWSDDNTTILTELFVQQVRAGNRPDKHLTQNAYEEVAKDFKVRTGLEYTRLQLKNKWDKLKTDYSNFRKLKLKETGGGWDYERNTIKQDDEWWKKAKIDIPGCGKFRKRGLRNENNLSIMFADITSDGTDHWNPASGTIPQSSSATSVFNVDDIQDVDLEETQTGESHADGKGKRLGRYVDGNNKKPKTSLVIQEQITRVGDIAERTQSSFESYMKKEESSSITSVMDLVVECGAIVGSDEYFIASELFVKREQREMFLHMTESAARLDWLRRKYNSKYGH
ncbi:L10-interacting MYB domain-containing protein-like [Triticum dicoccoides]|uniref:L10-interacting MYB domain-containing protein-like n=1 Tax=Triticum dicoccoides TaxID=85692 RepID=UPI0003D576DE|nr:L10-interacting MYB domain-containing protein-like isoform X1 [Triticum dicoccoides]XP_037475966.1 L10-interacting MYB domain-containing protein-like [Triticum dicoccoides]XP_037479885.1 L10-interacting MYB domain-containing protein-like [Triticum dicoccoides]XP_044347715.1 L10-interacting MYB domain-containing protein-like isoform X2 [Triticum aestivum]XP_044362899.1 L10-interacting MYB domain-containing protein-like isoform X2 [Triticum aestivum]XP_044365036.1 L10-interacting MYB domain-c